MTFRKNTALVILLHLALTAMCAAEPRPARTYRVPMRDGVRLATDVYLPSSDAADLPCLLVRTPYGRTRYNREFGSLVRWGYAVAIQDTRGRFESEGKAMAFLDDAWGERQDGHDTVEWLARQPFSNGRVGTLGASAMGITQLLLAPTQPEGLVCQYVLVAPGSLFHHSSYRGGVLREKLVVDWLRGHAHPDALRNTLAHSSYGEFWKQVDVVANAPRVEVPILHYGGWYDVFLQGTIDAFVAIQERGGEGARGRQKLVLGPWTHGGPSKRKFGDFELPGPACRVPWDVSSKRWFAHHLGGEANGIEELPAVMFYVMGPLDGTESQGNVWRSASSWPPPAVEEITWYLGPEGELERGTVPAPGSMSLVHDPGNPVPTVGGGNLFLDAGPRGQREIERRDDVLVFTTGPLDEDLEVTGRLTARLFVETKASDLDIAVRLTDVYPDGRSILVSDGIRRLSTVESRADRDGGEDPVEVDVDLWSTSMVFARGHSLRISIAGSNWPRYAALGRAIAGVGGGPEADRGPRRGVVHFGKGNPSRLVVEGR